MSTKLSSAITFSDEQSMLLDTAMDFLRTQSTSSQVRERMIQDDGFDAAQWQQMVELGWLGLAVPEDLGGSALGLGAAATIAEPMGRFLSATPFLATQLFIQGLLRGDESLASSILPEVVGGAVGTVALFEEDGNWDLNAVAATATAAADQMQLSGQKFLVWDAPQATYLLASVQYEGATALALIRNADLAANAIQAETVIDETRRSAVVTLDGVSIPASQLITGVAAQNGLNAIRNAALLLLSAEAAGGIAGALDILVEYLNTRTAFGRKIGSYQGLKHPTVDILVGLERSRSHVYHAASLLDAGEDAEIALRMAKAQASDSYAFAGDRAIQFHGGFGFTWDCDAQLFLRRALWTQYAFGDAAHHRRHLSRLMFAA